MMKLHEVRKAISRQCKKKSRAPLTDNTQRFSQEKHL
jgi:hypothetical protein